MLIAAPPHIEWRLIAIKKLFLVVAADSSHWRSRSESTLCPQTVSSTDLSCCALHEWPVFPPRGGTDDFAIAAFSLLRARAARIPNSQIGLTAAIRSFAAFVDLTSH
jgi:hypothetical protein